MRAKGQRGVGGEGKKKKKILEFLCALEAGESIDGDATEPERRCFEVENMRQEG